MQPAIEAAERNQLCRRRPLSLRRHCMVALFIRGLLCPSGLGPPMMADKRCMLNHVWGEMQRGAGAWAVASRAEKG